MTAIVVARLRYCFTVASGATPQSSRVEYWDGDILWVTPEDLSAPNCYWIDETRRKITKAGYESCGTTIAPRGSLVLTKRAPIGQVALLARPACSNQGCFLLSPRGDQDSRYYYYWLFVQTDRLQALGRGSTFLELSTDELKSLYIPVPPASRQRAIADYLDREMAQLNALIATKERLLELLVERRRALIAHAVTRGLEANVAFRDSGIPWLGEIPAHWETIALRFLVDFTSGATPNTGISEFWDGEIPWVSPKDMKRIEIHDAQDHVSELALSIGALRLIDPDSVLVVVRGMILAHSFPTAVTTAPVTINQDMKALRCRAPLVPYFLRDYFRGMEEYILSLADTSAHGTRKLDTKVLGRLEIAVPPIQEQRTISAYINETTAKMDQIEAAARSTISLLTERRSALITAAVAGQIDMEKAA